MEYETFAFASDYHGDRHDTGATKAFRSFCDDYRPHLRIFGGDLWDFRALRVGASAEEKEHSLRSDFEQGMHFLEWYRPSVVLLGNHDQRMYDAVEKDGCARTGPIADLCNIFIARFQEWARKAKATVLPYDKRKGLWTHKGMTFCHGFSHGKNAASEMARVYGNVLFGHGHSIDVASEPGTEPRIARMVGCLCKLDMTYNRAQLATLRQQHGWAYGAFLRAKRAEVLQATYANGVAVYAPVLRVAGT